MESFVPFLQYVVPAVLILGLAACLFWPEGEPQREFRVGVRRVDWEFNETFQTVQLKAKGYQKAHEAAIGTCFTPSGTRSLRVEWIRKVHR